MMDVVERIPKERHYHNVPSDASTNI